MNPTRSQAEVLLGHLEKAHERYQAALAAFELAISGRDCAARVHGIRQSTKNQAAAREELIVAIRAYAAATQVVMPFVAKAPGGITDLTRPNAINSSGDISPKKYARE
jgi:hypothetical protein